MTQIDPKNVLALAKQNDLLDDSRYQKLVLAAGISRNDHIRDSVGKALLGKAVQQWNFPFSPQVSYGDIVIGDTPRSKAFYLLQEYLTKHLLVVGQSGSGKTTFLSNLMDQLSIPFWSFDLKKDYRHLVRGRSDLLVLPWSKFKFNPLQPPRGVRPRRWAQVFGETFGHATSLLSGSKNYLMKQLVKLYQIYGLMDEVSPPYPSLGELQLLLERDNINYVRKTSNYRDRVQNRLEAMNRTGGSIFNCSQGYSIEKLLEQNVIFEFDGLSRDVQNFLMEILIAYVYEYRMANNQRGGELHHVFFVDEGKRLFSVYKERQDASGIPEIDMLTAKMREFGEGLVVADQEASKLTDSVKANTYTKVLLPTGDRKQFRAMAESMNLSERQMEFAQQLGTGKAIVQVGNRDPVPVKLHNYEVDKAVTDEELEHGMSEKWSELSYEERVFTPEFELEIGFQEATYQENPNAIEASKDSGDISNEADRLLEDVVKHPFKPLTKRYDRFSSRYKGNKAKNELVDQGFVVERHITDQGSRRKLLELTDKGRKYAGSSLEIDTKRQGRGGIAHQYWQHNIKEAFEQAGWNASIEKSDADIYATTGNTELVVEVVMGNNQREIEHVEKHLQKVEKILLACHNRHIMDGMKERLRKNDLYNDNVQVRQVQDLNIEEFP